MRPDPRTLGERQAIRCAGPWPVAGSVETFQAAAERAVREARRTGDLEYRWVMRFRLWERPADPRIEQQAQRLAARRRRAIEIAEDRAWLMRTIFDTAAGTA